MQGGESRPSSPNWVPRRETLCLLACGSSLLPNKCFRGTQGFRLSHKPCLPWVPFPSLFPGSLPTDQKIEGPKALETYFCGCKRSLFDPPRYEVRAEKGRGREAEGKEGAKKGEGFKGRVGNGAKGKFIKGRFYCELVAIEMLARILGQSSSWGKPPSDEKEKMAKCFRSFSPGARLEAKTSKAIFSNVFPLKSRGLIRRLAGRTFSCHLLTRDASFSPFFFFSFPLFFFFCLYVSQPKVSIVYFDLFCFQIYTASKRPGGLKKGLVWPVKRNCT